MLYKSTINQDLSRVLYIYIWTKIKIKMMRTKLIGSMPLKYSVKLRAPREKVQKFIQMAAVNPSI